MIFCLFVVNVRCAERLNDASGRLLTYIIEQRECSNDWYAKFGFASSYMYMRICWIAEAEINGASKNMNIFYKYRHLYLNRLSASSFKNWSPALNSSLKICLCTLIFCLGRTIMVNNVALK